MNRKTTSGDMPQHLLTEGTVAASCGDGEVVICSATGREIIDEPEFEDEPPILIGLSEFLNAAVDDAEEDEEDYDPWALIERREHAKGLAPSRVFIERATPHGIYCILGGVQYYIRYRQIMKEQQLVGDRPLTQLLDYMDVGLVVEVEQLRLTFDFRRLQQTGLMFWQSRHDKRPVKDMVLVVRRLSRTSWEMLMS